MRHQLFIVLFSVAAVACSSSSSSGSPTTDSGHADTSGGGDTGGGDTGGGTDTRSPPDVKPDTRGSDTPTDSGGGTCDPVAQTGCTAPSTKCTAVDDGTGVGTMPGCVTPSGTAAADDSCTRDSETPAGVGHDSCAAGSYCSGYGSLSSPPDRHCRKFCADDTGCPTGHKCMALIVDPSGSPLDGICVPTCTLFGTDCPSGLNCGVTSLDEDGSNVIFSCRQVGTAAVGAPCVTSGGTAGPAPYDCVADSLCFDPAGGSGTAFVCNGLCDGTHTCPTGKTCNTSGTGLPTGDGVCN
jgi:hypothetical protein